MVKYIIQEETLANLGDKVRALTGTDERMSPVAMAQALDNVANDLGDWAGPLTFSGTYANSTYFTESGCSLAVDNRRGMAFVTVQGGTSTSYENIYFLNPVLPDGVTFLTTQTYGGNTSGTTSRYFTAAFTGITSRISVNVDLSAVNSSYDYVQATVTITYC